MIFTLKKKNDTTTPNIIKEFLSKREKAPHETNLRINGYGGEINRSASGFTSEPLFSAPLSSSSSSSSSTTTNTTDDCESCLNEDIEERFCNCSGAAGKGIEEKECRICFDVHS